MKPQLNIQRIEDCLEWLELSAQDMTSAQPVTGFVDHIAQLAHTLAWVNGQMAVAAERLNDRKAKAYETLAASSVANQKYFSPSLAKEYIAAKCKEEQYAYDIAERASRTTYHQIEAFRSSLSALKEELKVLPNV